MSDVYNYSSDDEEFEQLFKIGQHEYSVSCLKFLASEFYDFDELITFLTDFSNATIEQIEFIFENNISVITWINHVLENYLRIFDKTQKFECIYMYNYSVGELHQVIKVIERNYGLFFENKFLQLLKNDLLPGVDLAQIFSFITKMKEKSSEYKIIFIDRDVRSDYLAYVQQIRDEKYNFSFIFISKEMGDLEGNSDVYSVYEKLNMQKSNMISKVHVIMHEYSHKLLKTQDYCYGYHKCVSNGIDKNTNADNFALFLSIAYLYLISNNKIEFQLTYTEKISKL